MMQAQSIKKMGVVTSKSSVAARAEKFKAGKKRVDFFPSAKAEKVILSTPEKSLSDRINQLIESTHPDPSDGGNCD